MKSRLILGAVLLAALAPLAVLGAPSQSMQSKKTNSTATRSASQSSQKNGSSSASGSSSSAAVQSGTQISAELLTSLDARHAKPGQRVVAKVTRDVKQNGHTVIRKGSKLVGHVVSAQAGSKAAAGSHMEVAFDQLLQGKSTSSLNTVVTSIVSAPAAPALAPMPMPAPMPAPAMGGGSARGGGLVGGAVGSVGSTVGGAAGASGQVVGNAGGIAGNAAGMGQNAAGVTGNAIRVTSITGANGNASAGMSNRLANANLAGSGAASNREAATSVFSSPNRNLDLQSGTRFQMQVVGSAQAHPPAAHH